MFLPLSVYRGMQWAGDPPPCADTPPRVDTHLPRQMSPWADTPTPWAGTSSTRRPLKRTVRLLLECILV